MSAFGLSTLHSPNSFSRCIVIMWGLLGSLSGCLGVPQVETPIHQSPQGQVILKTFTDTSVKASHPTVIDLELLQETFRGLRVLEHKELLAALVSGEGQELAVFTEQELQFLAPFIMDALTQATPEEFVWFQLTNQKQPRPSSTSGAMYFSNNLLRLGLNEFHADRRHAKLSSTPSFSPTRLRNWSLGFFPADANRQDRSAPDTFPLQAQIGSVAIALHALHIQ